MNKAKLRGILVEKGYTYKTISQAIGMCERAFCSKMNGGAFNLQEVRLLIDVLQIENPQEIFLSK